MIYKYFAVLLFTSFMVIVIQLYNIHLWSFGDTVRTTGYIAQSCWSCRKQQQELNREAYYQNFSNATGPLLTLFTSIKDTADRREIHERTLRNWAALRPAVQPVLYVTGSESYDWTVPARAHGWHIRSAPKLTKGIPVLKELFRDAAAHFNDTPFYAFANSDNLFDASLADTLRAFLEVSPSNMFVVGRRTNVETRNITHDVGDLNYVAALARSGKLFKTNAEDYFITTAYGFPWELVPDFVIGRPGYDNWLVAMAIEWGVTIIDATNTIHDLHQTGSDGNMSGWNSTADLCVNRNMVGAFDYHPGHTMCVPWYTARTVSGTIATVKRTSIPKECAKLPSIKRYKNQPCV